MSSLSGRESGARFDEASARILVVDDEEAIRRLLRASLSSRGYTVHEAADGEHALEQAQAVHPQVILLDLGLPDISGLEVTRCLRQWTQVPIIILSVREEESDKVGALDAGADDYLTKPFGPGELLARIRAALRRANTEESEPLFSTGELSVNLTDREVRVGGDPVQLTPIEYDLLTLLVRHAGKVLTHRQLVREIWGGIHYNDALHLLRVNVSNLRHKLGEDTTRPNYIMTEPGVGYRLRTEV